MTTDAPIKVLVAPLNWGLGHSTRCVPIIKTLHSLGADVHLASSGGALRLLKLEFPDTPITELADYRIRYSHKRMEWSMILQSPKILRAIRNEQKQIAELQQSHQFDLIISDNRFGVYHRDCKNVFISHQLNLQVNGYWKYAKPFIDAQHQSFWSHYQELWIPDEPGDESLSGDLSNASFPGDIKERFIGTLSRLKKKPAPEKKYETLSIISGPEPQRSHLEEKICLELKSVPGKHLVIRGVESERMENGNITKLGLQNGEEISKRIAESKIVISRSGYTSLMDYIHLGVRAIIIPTPGQTEQEYLAKRMKEKEWFYAVDQDQLDLVTALSEVKKYEPPTRRNHLLEKELKESLSFSEALKI